jgi:hypothetical protein
MYLNTQIALAFIKSYHILIMRLSSRFNACSTTTKTIMMMMMNIDILKPAFENFFANYSFAFLPLYLQPYELAFYLNLFMCMLAIKRAMYRRDYSTPILFIKIVITNYYYLFILMMIIVIII